MARPPADDPRTPADGPRPPADDPRPPVVPVPAATVVLLRPGPEGPEVLLTRRPDSMAFAAGLHVFPGGRLDPIDADPRLVARARGPRDDPDFLISHRIAAIRETWEEVGVLLGAGRVRRVEADAAETAADAETADEGGRDQRVSPRTAETFVALCDRLDLELPTDELVEVARWTTPRVFPRRFDTRFFVAALPEGARIRPDPREVAGHRWLTPRAALKAMAGGAIAMWPPTSTTLQHLERATSFETVRDRLPRAPEGPIRIERLDPGLRVMTGQSAFGPAGRPANTVLVGRREVVVVDPGDPGEGFLDAVEAEVAAGGGRIVAIALSHVDPGHAAGSEELRSRTGAPLLAGPGGAAPLCWPLDEIGDGAMIGQGDGRLRALATPGHRPDHLAFLIADGTLLAGDALTDPPAALLPPEGDPAEQAATLDRLAVMLEEGSVRRVVPGHGGPILVDPTTVIARSLAVVASAPTGR